MPEVQVDLTPIGGALIQAIIDHIGELGTAMWAAFTTWLYAGLRAMFLEMMRAALLSIPRGLTDQFGPVVRMMPNTTLLAGATAAAAMALLGLKVILQRLPIQTAFVEGVIGRIVLYVAVVGLLPWIAARSIEAEQSMAESVGLAGVEAILPPPASLMDFTQTFAMVIMIVLGVRLWFKLASNVVHVATALVWSPLAMIAGIFPQGTAIASMWWYEFLGRLAGAVLATIAVFLGLALAVSYSGLLPIAGAGGAFLAAADLVDWLARTPGQRMGGVLGVVGDGVHAGMSMARGNPVSAGAQAAGMRALGRSDAARATERFFGYD